MFSTHHFDVFGPLKHEGLSRHWTGEVIPSGETDPVPVSVDGTVEGPTQQQTEAAAQALKGWSALLAEAESELATLLHDVELDSAAPWSSFSVAGVAVLPESYAPGESIHMLLELEHVDYPNEFRPALDVQDGRFIEVLSGS